MARAIPARSDKRPLVWLQGLAAGIGTAVLPGVATLLGVLLLPAMAAFMLMTPADRPAARPMLLMGAAASVMPLRQLWDGGGGWEAALLVLSDPGRPLLAWAACSAGWLAAQLATVGTALLTQAAAQRTTRALQNEHASLVTEWVGLEES